MRFDGSISVNVEDFGRYFVSDSKKSNGLIYVPKEWIHREVMVLVLSKDENKPITQKGE
jgi:hypothetical protein